MVDIDYGPDGGCDWSEGRVYCPEPPTNAVAHRCRTCQRLGVSACCDEHTGELVTARAGELFCIECGGTDIASAEPVALDRVRTGGAA